MKEKKNRGEFLRMLGKVETIPDVSVEVHHVNDEEYIISTENKKTITGQRLEDIFPEDWKLFSYHIKQAVAKDQEVVFDEYFQSVHKCYKIFINPLVDQLLEICFVDQSSLYNSRKKLNQKNQLLNVLNKINSEMIQSADPLSLLLSVKRIMIEELKYSSVQFVFTHKSFLHLSTIEVEPLHDRNCISRINLLKDVYIDTREEGQCMNCISGEGTGKQCIVTPILKNNDVFGVFVLSDDQIEVYDTDRIDFIRQIANNLSTTLFKMVVQDNPAIADSELNRYSNELSQRNKELEDKNKQLNKLNRKMRDAKEKAEESDKLKSAFLANMSHEIRTPLNGVIGFCQLLNSSDLSEPSKVHSYVNTIMDSSNQLLKTINNIIMYAKIEAEQTENVMIECSLNSELNSIFYDISNWQNGQFDKNIEMSRSYGLQEHEDRILVDIIHLKDVIRNLLDNAIKFTEEGEIELLYRLEKDHLLFMIKDTGIGILPEKKQVIFNRFRQSDDTLTRKYGGMGLGLSIVSNLVSLMNGQLWIKSKEGEGTAVYFTVPYEIPEHNEGIREKLKSLKSGTLKSMLNKEILVVEDDPASSEYVKTAFEDLYTVRVAENGKDALNQLENSDNVSLVLLDIRLPDINGNELARQIRKKYPDLPIIAQTANAMLKDREKSLEAGCTDYLSKPIAYEELLRVIKKHI